MIELVVESRCIRCAACIKVCPDDVFEADGDGLPIIARQNDCQTCYLCEAYCPTDALYVHPFKHKHPGLDPAEVESKGLLGSFARSVGWEKGRPAPKAPKPVSQ